MPTTNGRAAWCATPRLAGATVLFSPVHGQLDPGVLGRWILDDGLRVRLQVQLHKVPLARRGARRMSAALPLAVVCVSGGMDSSVTAAIAAADHRLAFLHANYGQRTEATRAFVLPPPGGPLPRRAHAGRGLHDAASDIGGSSLTDEAIAVREGDPEEGVVPTSYVPFRNAHLLAAATSWAEVLGASAIFVGAVWEDSSGYPDCRPEFYRAFQEVVRLGTRPQTRIEIVTPVIGLTKADIVRRGLALGVPFEKTWSCYQGRDEACGACESCRLRLRGFSGGGDRRSPSVPGPWQPPVTTK